jgi:hypothetical protein
VRRVYRVCVPSLSLADQPPNRPRGVLSRLRTRFQGAVILERDLVPERDH